ncbi:MAG TPA: SMC-Scp complex subunit ScpB [Sumerlaeia bacterium]|nr:SMC-Scp complex subunit ScpB [Sumerlaeia bacterium]
MTKSEKKRKKKSAGETAENPPAEMADVAGVEVQSQRTAEEENAPEGAAAEESDLAARVEEVDLGLPEDEEEPEALPSEIEDETALVEEAPGAAAVRTPAELKAAVECLLFTTSHALSLKQLRGILGGVDVKTLRGAVSQLQAEYDARGGGLQIIENNEGFQMCTRPQYADVVLQLHRQRKRNPLTTTALETLAIVAYKQPITRAEIEMIRGVESSGVLRNLCDMGMIKVVGRKEVIGRPQLYGVTSLFLGTFGLRSLNDLPTIHALRRQYKARPVWEEEEEQERGTSPPAPPPGSESEAPVPDDAGSADGDWDAGADAEKGLEDEAEDLDDEDEALDEEEGPDDEEMIPEGAAQMDDGSVANEGDMGEEGEEMGRDFRSAPSADSAVETQYPAKEDSSEARE